MFLFLSNFFISKFLIKIYKTKIKYNNKAYSIFLLHKISFLVTIPILLLINLILLIWCLNYLELLLPFAEFHFIFQLNLSIKAHPLILHKALRYHNVILISLKYFQGCERA